MYPVINQCCRTSCCASFHSGDLDQVVTFVQYTVLLYILTHMSAVPSAGRSLSFTFVSYNYKFLLLQLLKHFLLRFRLEIYKLSFSVGVGCSYHSTLF
jgi:hypothetical protein